MLVFRSAIFFAFLLGTALPTDASLLPERVFVVVNQDSWSSKTIANRFTQLHRIPQSNVYSIPWDGSVTVTSFDRFRDQILRPVLQELKKRKLDQQVDCVVYSSDFPYAIKFASELSSGDKDRFPTGSLTGLTYLYQQLPTPGAGFRDPTANWYALGTIDDTQPFRARTAWDKEGRPDPNAERRYLLSAMLGYTSGRGNGYEHVSQYLDRATIATGAQPGGTVYLGINDDVRAQIRSRAYVPTAEALRNMGRQVEVFQGRYPKGKTDIFGCVTGHHEFRIRTSKSRILPGAICENLTSFGGVLTDTAYQVPLTDFLKYGAAASSGTVVEPYGLAQKFPDPAMHVHYARGLTLAESFYRATRSPYQILLVGDPLCQPFLRMSQVDVGEFATMKELQGVVTLRPSVDDRAVKRFDLYFDGRLVSTCRDDQAFEFDTAIFPDGYHEFRVVAMFDDAIDSACRWVGWKRVQNRSLSVQAEVVVGKSVPLDDLIRLKLSSSDPMTYFVFHQRQQIGVPSSNANLTLKAHQFGLGVSNLHVVGVTADRTKVFAEPISVRVTPPRLMPKQLRRERRPLMLAKSDGTQTRFDSRKADWIKQLGIEAGREFEIRGDLKTDFTGVHQFQVLLAGRISIHVDGSKVLEAWHAQRQRKEVPVNLAAGHHAIRIKCTPADPAYCELRFGYRGARKLKSPPPPKPKPQASK